MIFFLLRGEKMGGGEIKPLYRFCGIFPSVRGQYYYYANRFKGAVVFMQVGRFYEFYTETSPAPVMFSLKALKHNKRGAKYGFPLFMGERNAKRAGHVRNTGG